jgi:putative MATE family efflux protein
LSTRLIDSPGTLRPLLRAALPVLAEQVLHMLVGFSDAWLAGKYLERPHLAAMSLLPYALWLLSELFVGVAIAAAAMTARAVGAGNREMAQRVTNQSLLIGAALAVVFTLSGLLVGDRLPVVMNLRGEAAALAARYLSFVYPVIPAIMIDRVGIACLRGAGRMASGLLVMVVVNIVNLCVSWPLMLGWGGLPRLGWDALAIGAAAGYCTGAVLVLCLLQVGGDGLRLDFRLLRPDTDLIRRLLRIGVPGGIDILSIVGCQFWFLALINALGELASSAHGVALRIESMAYLPGEAFQVAAATLAGQFLGARDYQRAGRSVLMACLVGGGLMIVVGVAFYFWADSLVWVFLNHERSDVARTAAPLLRIVSLAMPALALVMILSGALRGAGDTRWPLLFSLVGFLGVRIPLTWLLTQHASWGVEGAWYAMLADLSFRCLLVVYRFWHGGWKRVEV